MSEGELRALPAGWLQLGMFVRDEQGSGWLPIENSPLAAYVAQQVHARSRAEDGAGIRVQLMTGLVFAGLLYGVFYYVGEASGCSRTMESVQKKETPK